MALKIYTDSELTKQVIEIIGQQTTGNEIITSEKPTEVRLFNSQYPNGKLLTEVTETPSTDEWKWNDTDKKVILGFPIPTDTVVVQFSGTERLFESQLTESGLTKFVTNQSDPAHRTKKQQIWIQNDDPTKRYSDLRIELIGDLVSGQGSSPDWIEVSNDGVTWSSASSISVSSPFNIVPSVIEGVGSVSIWIKCTVPQNTPVSNYRDTYIQLFSIESQID